MSALERSRPRRVVLALWGRHHLQQVVLRSVPLCVRALEPFLFAGLAVGGGADRAEEAKPHDRRHIALCTGYAAVDPDLSVGEGGRRASPHVLCETNEVVVARMGNRRRRSTEVTVRCVWQGLVSVVFVHAR